MGVVSIERSAAEVNNMKTAEGLDDKRGSQP